MKLIELTNRVPSEGPWNTRYPKGQTRIIEKLKVCWRIMTSRSYYAAYSNTQQLTIDGLGFPPECRHGVAYNCKFKIKEKAYRDIRDKLDRGEKIEFPSLDITEEIRQKGQMTPKQFKDLYEQCPTAFTTEEEDKK